VAVVLNLQNIEVAMWYITLLIAGCSVGLVLGALLFRCKVMDMIEVLIIRGRQRCLDNNFEQTAREAGAIAILKELKNLI
jgi:hypothetical protein